jgi:putative transposase
MPARDWGTVVLLTFLCESFFATLECELLDRERFRTIVETCRAVFDYIEGWYNPRRRHSALGYESPLRYERTHAASGLRAAAAEKSRAVLPPGSTLTEGGAISVSPPTGRPQGRRHRGDRRAARLHALRISAQPN